jgi:hypothetical protein
MAKTAKKKVSKVIPDETIIRKIFNFRGHKVMLDSDLAALYEVETKVLNQAVKRNIGRFPLDFMFQLTTKEIENLKSRFVTSSWGGRRKLPFAFSEQGVAMLSGVINSAKAVQMNIAIMRAFVEIRRTVINNKNIAGKLKALEERLGEHDVQLNQIYDAIENLMDKKVEQESWQERKRIGYK